MGSKSNYLELRQLDHVLGAGTITTPANVWFGLFSAMPSDTGGGTELTTGTAPGYARLAVVNDTTNFPAAATGGSGKGEKQLAVAHSFPVNPGPASWPNVIGFGLFDASTAGNLLIWGEITPIVIAIAAQLVIPAGSIIWRED